MKTAKPKGLWCDPWN